jgi:hypothetical protein
MTSIQVESVSPFAARILVDGNLVAWQPYNPDGAVPWVSEDEARAWATATAQSNIDAGVWPPLG